MELTATVIITTYNRPDHLAEAIASALAQSWPRVETIVVDDASHEPAVVPDGVRLVRHRRNMGAGAARNTGLAHATGKLVMFLDDDDWIHPDRIRWAVEQIGDRRTHACAAELVWPDRTKPAGLKFDGDLTGRFPADGQPAIGQCVHRIEDVEQFDPTMRAGEDSEWWQRMGPRRRLRMDRPGRFLLPAARHGTLGPRRSPTA